MDDERIEAVEIEDVILEDQIDLDVVDSPSSKLTKSNIRRRIEDYFEERRILDAIDYIIDENYKNELDTIYHVESIPINDPKA